MEEQKKEELVEGTFLEAEPSPMRRTITTKRLYSLGDYKNISFSDTIEDIPEEVALNRKAIALLRNIQMFQIERSYLKYMKLRETTHRMSIEESIELIDELDITASRKFNELFEEVPEDEVSQREDEEEEEQNENA